MLSGPPLEWVFMQIHYEWICIMLSTDVYVWLSVCLSLCNEMYCYETTNVASIPFDTNIPLDNGIRSAKWCQKNFTILAAGHQNFWRPTFENAKTFEPFEISTPDRRHFAQDWIL
jgi:hypothetical protein